MYVCMCVCVWFILSSNRHKIVQFLNFSAFFSLASLTSRRLFVFFVVNPPHTAT